MNNIGLFLRNLGALDGISKVAPRGKDKSIIYEDINAIESEITGDGGYHVHKFEGHIEITDKLSGETVFSGTDNRIATVKDRLLERAKLNRQLAGISVPFTPKFDRFLRRLPDEMSGKYNIVLGNQFYIGVKDNRLVLSTDDMYPMWRTDNREKYLKVVGFLQEAGYMHEAVN